MKVLLLLTFAPTINSATIAVVIVRMIRSVIANTPGTFFIDSMMLNIGSERSLALVSMIAAVRSAFAARALGAARSRSAAGVLVEDLCRCRSTAAEAASSTGKASNTFSCFRFGAGARVSIRYTVGTTTEDVAGGGRAMEIDERGN